MSESIHITGSDLPEWATESTLEKIANAIDDLAGLSSDQKKQMRDGFKDMKETGKVTRENIKKAGKGGSDNIFKDATKGLGKFADEANKGSLSIESLQDPLDEFEKGLSSSAKRMGLIGGAFAALGAQIGLAIGDIKETVGALSGMTDAGIRVQGGFQGLRQTMADTGMSLDEVTGITDKYARTVGNVGLRSIMNLAKTAEDGAFSFREYGMVVAEGAEFQAKMLESQRLGGIFEAQDKRANSMALQENIKNLTAYSKILNVSRTEMAQAQIEAKSRADVQRRFNSMDEDTRKAANASFDQFSAIVASLGPEAKGLGDMMTTIIADPAAVNSEAFATLAQASPQAAEAILELRKKILEGENVSQEDIINRLLDPLDAAAKSGQLEMLSMNDAIGALVNDLGGPVLNSLRNYNQRLGEVMKEGGLSEAEAMKKLKEEGVDKAVSGAVGLDQELRDLSETIKSSRIDVFMNLFGPEAASGVEAITSAVRTAADGIETLGNVDYRSAIEGAIEALGEFGSWLGLQIDTIFSGIATTMSDLWNGIKDIVNKIVTFPSMMWNTVVNKLNDTFGTSFSTVDIPNSDAPQPAFPAGARLADVDRASARVAGMQQNLEGAIAGGADANQVEFWRVQLEIAQATLTELRRIRTHGANALTD